MCLSFLPKFLSSSTPTIFTFEVSSLITEKSEYRLWDTRLDEYGTGVLLAPVAIGLLHVGFLLTLSYALS